MLYSNMLTVPGFPDILYWRHVFTCLNPAHTLWVTKPTCCGGNDEESCDTGRKTVRGLWMLTCGQKLNFLPRLYLYCIRALFPHLSWNRAVERRSRWSHKKHICDLWDLSLQEVLLTRRMMARLNLSVLVIHIIEPAHISGFCNTKMDYSHQ